MNLSVGRTISRIDLNNSPKIINKYLDSGPISQK